MLQLSMRNNVTTANWVARADIEPVINGGSSIDSLVAASSGVSGAKSDACKRRLIAVSRDKSYITSTFRTLLNVPRRIQLEDNWRQRNRN